MTAKDSYLAAQFPNRFRVLFWNLHAFTLGHAMLLEWLDSPFVTGNRAPERVDCALVIALCTRDIGRAERLARSRFIRWHLRRFFPMKFQTQLAFHQITRYLQHFSMGPKCWSGATGGRTNGTPFLVAVKLTHMAFLNRTEKETLDLPFSKAIHEYAGYWELKDRIKIVSTDEESAMEAAKMLAETRN